MRGKLTAAVQRYVEPVEVALDLDPPDVLVRADAGAEVRRGAEQLVGGQRRLVRLLHAKDRGAEVVHRRRHEQGTRRDQRQHASRRKMAVKTSNQHHITPF